MWLRAISAFAALSLGVAILAVSLLAGNTTVWSTSGAPETSQKEFYWSDQLLPDHVAYPVLMAVDRAKLEFVDPNERIYVQLEYGRRRYEAAEALLAKGKPDLALTTLTKAEKYWLSAGLTAIDDSVTTSETARRFTLRTLEYYVSALDDLKHEFSDSERAVIDRHQEELRAVANHLHGKVAVAHN